MTLYNFNLGIGLASSGVEYAQGYRSRLLANLPHLDQRYIFSDFMPKETVYSLAPSLGISSVIWFYDILRGATTHSSTLTKEDLEGMYGESELQEDDSLKFPSPKEDTYVVAHRETLASSPSPVYNRIDFVVDGYLVRREYYSGYSLYCTEYYKPSSTGAKSFARTFYDGEGIPILEEVTYSPDHSTFTYQGKHYPTKESLYEVFLEKLNIQSDDTVLLDRATTTALPVFKLKKKVGFYLAVVIHAEHYVPANTSPTGILWNNYYDYVFRNAHLVDTFITSTQAQTDKLRSQFKAYSFPVPSTTALPVGYGNSLKGNLTRNMKKLVTASRLSSEKHLEILLEVLSRVEDKEVTLDIYGTGKALSDLESLRDKLNLQERVFFKGHQDLSDSYQDYGIYVSASSGEGFGLSLMEATLSGCSLVGYDVDYGNPTFCNGKNGRLLPPPTDFYNPTEEELTLYAQTLQELISQPSTSFVEESWSLATPYLKENVLNQWKDFLNASSR